MDKKEVFTCVIISFIILVSLRFILNQTKKETIIKSTRNSVELPFPDPLNIENQQVNIENWAVENNPEGNVIRKMIQETHSRCPVMNDHRPKVSVCIQDPKTNKGYIISLCCTHCLEKIQQSLKTNDKVFTIQKLNNVDVLYYKNEPKQIAVACNRMNMEEVMKIVGTRSA